MGGKSSRIKTQYTHPELKNIIQMMENTINKDYKDQFTNILNLYPLKIWSQMTHYKLPHDIFSIRKIVKKEYYHPGDRINILFSYDVAKLIHDLYEKALELQRNQIKQIGQQNTEKPEVYESPPPYTYNSNIDIAVK